MSEQDLKDKLKLFRTIIIVLLVICLFASFAVLYTGYSHFKLYSEKSKIDFNYKVCEGLVEAVWEYFRYLDSNPNFSFNKSWNEFLTFKFGEHNLTR